MVIFHRINTANTAHLYRKKDGQKKSMHQRNIMKRRQERAIQKRAEGINIWQEAARLFSFKEIPDVSGNTHILWAHLSFHEGQPLNIRAGEYVDFEALQNHEHLLDDLTDAQFHLMISIVDDLCRALRDVLAVRYPERDFHVWGLVQNGGTVIVRFYQNWQGEEYWSDDMQVDENVERLIHYQTGGKKL